MAYVSFWALPAAAAVMWFGMLLAMLIDWLADHRPRYPSEENGQTIAYISDVGAEVLKPLFVTGCCITGILLVLAMVAERWLRHNGRLTRNTNNTEKALTILSIIFAICGSASLILLSVFDTLRHPSLHRLFLFIFMLGYVLSAALVCAEYQRLGIHYRDRPILRYSFWTKLFFILIEVCLSIVYGTLLYKRIHNPAAVLEWVIAFVFTFYILSFFVDLLPAVKTKHGEYSGAELGGADGMSGAQHANDRFAYGNAPGREPRIHPQPNGGTYL